MLHQSIREQSDDVFAHINRVLQKEQMPVSAIVRQWNDIEKITEYDVSGHQHYQDFNDARSLFYEHVEWKTGYPAATGIGTQSVSYTHLCQCDTIGLCRERLYLVWYY